MLNKSDTKKQYYTTEPSLLHYGKEGESQFNIALLYCLRILLILPNRLAAP